MIRGLIASIPVFLSLLVIYLIYSTVDKRIVSMIDNLFGFGFPGMGILILLILFYLVGQITSNVVGRQLFSLIDQISAKIPLFKTVYTIGKQLSSTLSLPENEMFQRAVLVEFLTPGVWTVGFITGEIIDRTENDLLYFRIYIPTPPNPTSGTMIIAPASKTRDPGWTIGEAMRMVISGGLIGPEEIIRNVPVKPRRSKKSKEMKAEVTSPTGEPSEEKSTTAD
jgi:uncharacterized membrane protein